VPRAWRQSGGAVRGPARAECPGGVQVAGDAGEGVLSRPARYHLARPRETGCHHRPNPRLEGPLRHTLSISLVEGDQDASRSSGGCGRDGLRGRARRCGVGPVVRPHVCVWQRRLRLRLQHERPALGLVRTGLRRLVPATCWRLVRTRGFRSMVRSPMGGSCMVRPTAGGDAWVVVWLARVVWHGLGSRVWFGLDRIALRRILFLRRPCSIPCCWWHRLRSRLRIDHRASGTRGDGCRERADTDSTKQCLGTPAGREARGGWRSASSCRRR